MADRLRHGHRTDDDPALTAVVHTARAYAIPWQLFDAFLASMRMDLTVTDYPDRDALDRYVHGSAEVIGLQLLPVLGTVAPREEAARTPRHWEKRFSSRTFCVTSTRICSAGGSICPLTSWPPTMSTATC
ncbi:squalene/phytoene synthase family protein [Mycobacterium xenopi 3993]|nr:squalene/phytoene synthase family protein [Mycobacterium xenopi 3993]